MEIADSSELARVLAITKPIWDVPTSAVLVISIFYLP
jgi:hypothetical protein